MPGISGIFMLAGNPIMLILLFGGVFFVLGMFYLAYGWYAWAIAIVLYFALKIFHPKFRKATQSMWGIYRSLIIFNIASIILFVDVFTGRPILMNTIGKKVPEEYHVKILEGEYEYLSEYTVKRHRWTAGHRYGVGDPYLDNAYLMSPLNMHYKLRFVQESGIPNYTKYLFEIDQEKVNAYYAKYPHLRYIR